MLDKDFRRLDKEVRRLTVLSGPSHLRIRAQAASSRGKSSSGGLRVAPRALLLREEEVGSRRRDEGAPCSRSFITA